MPRYIVKAQRPTLYWDQPMAPLGHPTVYPSEPVPTGILNADGAQIWRAPDPIGFLPPDLVPPDPSSK